MTAAAARKVLKTFANPEKAEFLKIFFKTGKGEYGAGDLFYGVKVPETRSIAKKFASLPLSECAILLKSKIHEERLLALLILVLQFQKADEIQKKKIYSFYMKNLRHVNNWDLVDSSATAIAGGYLSDKDRSPLYKLAKSKDLWKKRVAIIATFHFIRRNDFKDTLKIAEILLPDDHDLIHKAVGWMLREVGNRNRDLEEKFLRRHVKTTPRTLLSYAIEKFPPKLRQKYLKGEF